MKKVLLFVLLFAVCAFAQHDNAKYWGDVSPRDIQWGNVFVNTDSLKLMVTADSMFDAKNTDTLYTDMMLLPGDGLEGICVITFSIDSIDTPVDSVDLAVRFNFNKAVHGNRHWEETWYNIGLDMEADSLYIWRNISSDSTWWGPASGWQFRAIRSDADDDSCKAPNLGLYVR